MICPCCEKGAGLVVGYSPEALRLVLLLLLSSSPHFYYEYDTYILFLPLLLLLLLFLLTSPAATLASLAVVNALSSVLAAKTRLQR